MIITGTRAFHCLRLSSCSLVCCDLQIYMAAIRRFATWTTEVSDAVSRQTGPNAERASSTAATSWAGLAGASDTMATPRGCCTGGGGGGGDWVAVSLGPGAGEHTPLVQVRQTPLMQVVVLPWLPDATALPLVATVPGPEALTPALAIPGPVSPLCAPESSGLGWRSRPDRSGRPPAAIPIPIPGSSPAVRPVAASKPGMDPRPSPSPVLVLPAPEEATPVDPMQEKAPATSSPQGNWSSATWGGWSPGVNLQGWKKEPGPPMSQVPGGHGGLGVGPAALLAQPGLKRAPRL